MSGPQAQGNAVWMPVIMIPHLAFSTPGFLKDCGIVIVLVDASMLDERASSM